MAFACNRAPAVDCRSAFSFPTNSQHYTDDFKLLDQSVVDLSQGVVAVCAGHVVEQQFWRAPNRVRDRVLLGRSRVFGFAPDADHASLYCVGTSGARNSSIGRCHSDNGLWRMSKPACLFAAVLQVTAALHLGLHYMLVAGSAPNTKGGCQNCPLPLRAIPRAAKFSPPALLRFVSPSVCSGRCPLPSDHHCNTREGTQQ